MVEFLPHYIVDVCQILQSLDSYLIHHISYCYDMGGGLRWDINKHFHTPSPGGSTTH